RADPQEWLDNRAGEEAVDLGNGVFLERLRGDDGALPDQVMDASSSRGLNYAPVRQFGQLYSFWREIPRAEWDGPQMHVWDPTVALGEAAEPPRYVLDHAHGLPCIRRVAHRGHR